jgi:hypothetical protein
MWRKLLAALALTLVLVAGGTIFYADALVSAIATRALDSAGLELSYDKLALEFLDGRLTVSGLLLVDRENNRRLLSIGEADLQVVPLEIISGYNTNGRLSGRDAHVYLHLEEGGDPESTWEPGTWLGYRNLLPGEAHIGELVLHWRGDEPNMVTRLVRIDTTAPAGEEQMNVKVTGFHGAADFAVQGKIATVQELDGGLSAVKLQLELSSERYQSRGEVHGAVEGAGEALDYYLETELHSVDIKGVLERFDVDFDLHGAARVAGRLEGNLQGFSLRAKTASLDNMPHYRFLGSGRFDYDYDGGSDLDLDMEGELKQLGQLIDWVDLDVAELGSAQASVKIQGSLDNLLLRDALLTTRNDKGLQVEMRGSVRVNNLANNTLGDDRGIDAVVTGPELAVLQAWTGELEIETGPWRLAAHVREQDGKLLLRDIDLRAEGENGVDLTVRGQISDAGSLLDGNIAAVQGIELQAQMSSGRSKPLTDLAGQELRELGPVSASAALSGTGEKLLVREIDAEVGTGALRITAQKGWAQLALAPEFSYGGIRIPLTVAMDSSTRLSEWVDWEFVHVGEVQADLVVEQTAQGFALPTFTATVQEGEKRFLSVQGAVKQLNPPGGIDLAANFNGLPTGRALEIFARDLEGELDAGQLYGGFKLSSHATGWRMQDISIENRYSEQLKFEVRGRLQAAGGLVDMDLHLETAVSDTDLIQEVTGLELGALSGNLDISGSQHSIRIEGQTTLGSTDLTSRLLLTVGEDGLEDIKGSLTSASLAPSDVGLGQLINLDEDEELQEQITTQAQARSDEPLPLDSLPTFPIDLVLAAREIRGGQFQAENFSVHLRTGDGHYELINLLVKYTSGSARVNASLDTRPALPTWEIDAQLDDFRIERLRDFGAPGNVTGNANTLFHLETEGGTPNQMLGNLDGQFAIAFEDISLKGAAYDRLAVDTLAWFYTGGVLQEETRFNCVMGKFGLDQGIAVSDFMFAESDFLIAEGNATIDLPAGEMDMAITPRSKRRTFQIPGTIGIKGPLDNLQVSTAPISTAVDTSAQVLLFAPSVAMGVFDRTTSLFTGDKGSAATGQEEPSRKCPFAEAEEYVRKPQ